MNRTAFLVALFLMSCQDVGGTGQVAPFRDARVDPYRWAPVDDLGDHAVGLVTDGTTTWALVDDGVLETTDGETWLSLPTTGLPGAPLLWLGTAAGTLLVEVDGVGLMRWNGTEWVAPTTRPPPGLIASFNPRAQPVPYGATGETTGWLAAAGGLFRTPDAGDTWAPVPLTPDAGFNLLFTDILQSGDTLLAAAMLPAGLLPDEFADFLSGVVFESTDGGTTWMDAAPDAPFRYATGVTLDTAGTAHVSALDGGLYSRMNGAWQALGGPSDALRVSTFEDGVNVISATRGVWRRTERGWTGAGDGPMVGLSSTLALARDGQLFRLDEHAAGTSRPAGEATVHVALSFHVNLYHSYRGDSNTDDGYGIDLDVMRNTLDWLDRHPRARADWDLETHFSLGEWMQTDGADVLSRLQQRVASGVDEVRPMSWNNGAMTNHTEAEFKHSMKRAMDDLDAHFGQHVPGVQPQECMFTADHLSWYPEVGIEWATLFYSGTPFTALHADHTLPKNAVYNPFSLKDPDSNAALTTIPVYHHADMVNHGGLAGWATQIHQNHDSDQLLVIHFDADAESWEAFEQELAAVEALDFVEFTLLSDYVAEHPPTETVELVGDVADGTGDGFQSWAEKDFNHTLSTTIHQAREWAVRTEAMLDATAADANTLNAVQAHLDRALDARLLALSTTHFGLAAPVLHPDRVASATAYAELAHSEALAAFALAEALDTPADGELVVRNPHPESGTVLVETTVAVPADVWATHGIAGVYVADGETALAAETSVVDDSSDPVQVGLRFALPIEGNGTERLAWGGDGRITPGTGVATATTLFDTLPVAPPFTECAGERSVGSNPRSVAPTVDPHAVVTTDTRTWDLSFCDQAGVEALTWTAEQISGLDGIVWTVHAEMPDATGGTATDDAPWNLDAESVALSPLTCADTATSLQWYTFGGTTRTRPVRAHQQTWNGQAVNGWMAVTCASGTRIDIGHDAMLRTSLAMAPIRTSGDDTVIAPLGTLWGSPVRHNVRETGGHGAGDVITAVVGSQFRPAAPDWSGKTVHYRLLIGEDGSVEPGTLALFAHPPMVAAGAHPATVPDEDSGLPHDSGLSHDSGAPDDSGTTP